MFIDEKIALRMAEERRAEAIHAAEQMRLIRLAGAWTSARVWLGRSLVRLGLWLADQSSPALSSQPTRV